MLSDLKCHIFLGMALTEVILECVPSFVAQRVHVCVCVCGGGCVCSWFNSEEVWLNLSRKKKICEKNKSMEMKKVKITFFFFISYYPKNMSFKLPSSYFWEFHFFFSFCTRKGHFLQVFYFTLCRKADWLMIGIYKKSCFERCFEPVTRRFSWKKTKQNLKLPSKAQKCFGAYFIQETPKFNLSHQPYQKEHLLKLCGLCVHHLKVPVAFLFQGQFRVQGIFPLGCFSKSL